ncbi:hypothetical protein IF2G_00106 [Cordyceps javanica]|nr:hypothetical protein IF2G_00106 [Cordyceps javanica]
MLIACVLQLYFSGPSPNACFDFSPFYYSTCMISYFLFPAEPCSQHLIANGCTQRGPATRDLSKSLAPPRGQYLVPGPARFRYSRPDRLNTTLARANFCSTRCRLGTYDKLAIPGYFLYARVRLLNRNGRHFDSVAHWSCRIFPLLIRFAPRHVAERPQQLSSFALSLSHTSSPLIVTRALLPSITVSCLFILDGYLIPTASYSQTRTVCALALYCRGRQFCAEKVALANAICNIV